MTIDFSPIPQEINSVGDPALSFFKYYGVAGLPAEDNPKVPFVDNDFVTSSSAEQELNQFGRTSVQLFLQGLYSIAVFTKQKDDLEAVLVYRADFVGISISAAGGTDRVIDNIGNTIVLDEAGSKGALFSATTDSSLQYLDILAFDWSSTKRTIYYPNGANTALAVSATGINHFSPDTNSFMQTSNTAVFIQSGGSLSQVATSTYDLTAVSLTLDSTGGDASLNAVGGSVIISGDAVTIDATGTSNFSSSAGNLDLEAPAGVAKLTGATVNIDADGSLVTVSNVLLLNAIAGDMSSAVTNGDLIFGVNTDGNDAIFNIPFNGAFQIKKSGSTRFEVVNNFTEITGILEALHITSTTSLNNITPALVTKGTATGLANDSFMKFERGADDAFITMDSAGNLSFTASASDKRLKMDYSEVENTLDKLAKVPVYSGLMKMPGDTSIVHPWTYHIAEEMQIEFPEIVEGGKDEIDEKGDPVYQRIKQDKQLILWAALRDAKLEIDELRQELTDFKAFMGQV